MDGFATSLGEDRVAATTVDLLAADYATLNPITCRLYLGDSSNRRKDGFYLVNLELAGTSSVPEPHEWVMCAAGSIVAFVPYRRSLRERGE